MLFTRALLALGFVIAAGAATAQNASFDVPVLTFPPSSDIVSTQSCETDPATGVIVCGSSD